MVSKTRAKIEAKRLKGLRFVPEFRDDIGEILQSAENEGHLERAVQHVLNNNDDYPTPRIMQAAMDTVPKTAAAGCGRCYGIGMVYVDDSSIVGSMKPCDCPAGDLKRVLLAGGER